MEATKKNVTILPDSMGLNTEMYVFSCLGQSGIKLDSTKIQVKQNQ